MSKVGWIAYAAGWVLFLWITWLMFGGYFFDNVNPTWHP